MKKNLLILLILLTLSIGFLFRNKLIKTNKNHKTQEVALTPPMGWNGWNKFKCGNANEKLIKEIVDALVKSGMKDVGYQYVVIDDCWQAGREKNGMVIVNKKRFPNGMKALSNYIHSKGLKFGIYTSAGEKTCENRVGSFGYEEKDLKTYFSWGIDFLKLDWCGVESLDSKTEYQKWKNLLKKYNKQIVFSISNFGIDKPWEWGRNTGNMWRTTPDIRDDWPSIIRNIKVTGKYLSYSGPGGWNDADMLQVGNGSLSDIEYKSHFSMWAIMSSPLIAGNDLRNMSKQTKKILTNPEVIAINQDRLGLPAKIIWSNPEGLEIWSKKLSKTGEFSVILLNKTPVDQTMSVNWKDLGLLDIAYVRDLWERKNKGLFFKAYSKPVSSHGVIMLKIKGVGIPNFLKKKLRSTTNKIPQVQWTT